MKKWIGLVMVLAGGAVLADVPREERTGHRERKMANCPSAVRGARTKVSDLKDGVEVTVTAPDPAAQEEIRQRAKRQEAVALQPATRGAIEHTGGGTGSGKFGFCPGMLQGTRLAVDPLPDGARLTVRADDPKKIDEVQKLSKDRARHLRTTM